MVFSELLSRGGNEEPMKCGHVLRGGEREDPIYLSILLIHSHPLVTDEKVSALEILDCNILARKTS